MATTPSQGQRAARNKQPEPAWLVRLWRAHVRLWTSIAISIAVALIMMAVLQRRSTALLVGWDIGVACYLVMVGLRMGRSSVADIRRHAAEQDEGAFGILLLTVGAAMAS